MRHIGNLNDPVHAERLAAFLVTQNIDATADDENSHWAIWVKDEDQVDAAKRLLAEFEKNPEDSRYVQAVRKAQSLKQQEEVRRREMQKRVVEMRTQWNRGSLQRAPLTIAIIVGCTILAFMTNFGDGSDGAAGQTMSALRFISSTQSVDWTPYTLDERLVDIKKGQVWRILTPAFLHYGVWHLVMNMFWVYMFGAQIERRKGTLTFACLVLVTAVVSNLFQCLVPPDLGGSVLSAGFSGVVYGLLGYIWVKMYTDPGAGLFVAPPVFFFLIIWMFLGFTPIIEQMFGTRIGNWAHCVGLLTGMAFAYLPLMLKPSRQRTSDDI